jgi:hypothetical protein
MANYSKKVMGKEVGDAKVYAEPHTMSGKKVTTAQSAVTKPGNGVDNINISVGGISKGNYKPENPYGVGVMRGYGAATKGRKTSGKMG